MVTLVIFMVVILMITAVIGTYVAFPYRGERLPAAPWLGDAMRKGVDALPLLDEGADAAEPETSLDLVEASTSPLAR
ncbi:MAG: hypothetical protein ACRCYU_14810 [Nocardioides sp.]